MADIMPYLGYEPQYSEEELKRISVSVPDVISSQIEAAKSEINRIGLSYKIVGSGETVIKQLPQAGSSVYNGGTVILYTDDRESETTSVPNLIGLTAGEVNRVAASAGINVEFSGNTASASLKSYSQSIDAGTSVSVGEVVTVYFRDEETVDLAQ